MKPREITSETRGRNVCLFGLVIQVVLGMAMMLLYGGNTSIATLAAALHLLGGIFIWTPLIIIYHQRKLVAEESLESQRLRQEREAGGGEALFELEEEEFLIQQRRLRWMYRWLLRTFVLVFVAFLLICSLTLLPKIDVSAMLKQVDDAGAGWVPVRHASLSMFFAGGVAFIAFLFSRYTSGIAREPAGRLMRAGSVYLFGNAFVGLLLVVCFGLVSSNMPVPERILAYAIFVMMLVLGIESLINYVLDLYRPRQRGEAPRPAFESRLCGLVSEPGSIAKSIAEAFNYQFGFEVSATWFYKMLERAVVPLLALSIVVLIGMTSFVLVDANELAVIERYGKPTSSEPIGPGLHIKAPWPIERVRKANVGLIEETIIGEVRASEEDLAEKEKEDKGVLTWTDDHETVPYVDLLVATPTRVGLSDDGDAAGQRSEGRAVAVSILRVSMPVQYHVKKSAEGVFDYLYNYKDPAGLLRDIAYRELVKRAVHFDYQGIMGPQRMQAAEELAKAIQRKSDEMRLGFEIMYVGLQDVHPPHEGEVAATFQKVATAEQEKHRLIQEAEIEETIDLNAVAGDVSRARAIDAKIREIDALSPSDSQKHADLDAEVKRLVLGDLEAVPPVYPVRGQAGQALAEARARALQAVQDAAGKAKNFDLELAAFRASPRIYKMRKTLRMLSEEMDGIRKYVIMVDPETTKVIVEFNEMSTSGLEIIDTGERQ